MTATSAHAAIGERGREIVAAADERALPLRLVGGVGIWHRLTPELRETYVRIRPVPRDVDLLAPAKHGAAVKELLGGIGYLGDERLNAWRGEQRQRWSTGGEEPVEIDVFVGSPPLCHPIDFSERLEGPGPSMDPTDLLLQKIQIVELNEKDLVDVAILLLNAARARDAQIDDERIAGLLAADWGFHHTATGNLDRTDAECERVLAADAAAARERLAALRSAIDAHPKTRRWRLRAKVGTRAQWYEDVEEVDR